MREKNTKDYIDYSKTKSFFEKRAYKYKEINPYSVTMYQDKNPDLVKQRNKKEIDLLLPKLQVNPNCRILDFACGIGRWSDAITDDIKEYCGIDFCKGLINIAIERNRNLSNRFFYVGTTNDFVEILKNNNKSKYNRILLIGALIYINDDEIKNLFQRVENICEKNAVIIVREPVGINYRLTLKDEYSDELCDNYNAIYRTPQELKIFFNEMFLSKGFFITEEGFLFSDDKLNNRKETAQYYFILER